MATCRLVGVVSRRIESQPQVARARSRDTARRIPAMAKRLRVSSWAGLINRSLAAITRTNLKIGTRAVGKAVRASAAKRKAPPGAGDWIPGMAIGAAGIRRWRLYRPPDTRLGERLPLLVMLHGCGQDANGFATSTRMNRIALRERFLVLYPEQDRLANAQGCWNWYDTASGRAAGEVALIMAAIDQVCLLYAADPARVAVAGLSAGASMAALVVTRHPARFKAVAMHSGIPPGTAHSTASALGAMHGRRATRPLATTPAGKAVMAASLPPLLVVHGGADHTVARSNGQAAAQAWADAAGARPGTARDHQRGKRYPMTVTDYQSKAKGGKGGTVAMLVEIERLGHAWSGGIASQPHSDAAGPDASRMVWAFVAKQFGKPPAS